MNTAMKTNNKQKYTKMLRLIFASYSLNLRITFLLSLEILRSLCKPVFSAYERN